MQGARAEDREPPVRVVGIHELSAHADEIVREVRTTGRAVDIMVDGETVARLNPTPHVEPRPVGRRWTDEERAAFWRDLDALTEEIRRAWPTGVSAVDAVREQRRDL